MAAAASHTPGRKPQNWQQRYRIPGSTDAALYTGRTASLLEGWRDSPCSMFPLCRRNNRTPDIPGFPSSPPGQSRSASWLPNIPNASSANPSYLSSPFVPEQSLALIAGFLGTCDPFSALGTVQRVVLPRGALHTLMDRCVEHSVRHPTAAF